MMKAYDRVEWNYLRGCLAKLGFTKTWIDSVMRCVTSVRYVVRVNGELTNLVVPTRGIRQGDPISPYLFLLCTEGLSCLPQKQEVLGELQGKKIVDLVLLYLIYCLQMIVFCLSEVIRKVLMRYTGL
jgi:hypothetical protein